MISAWSGMCNGIVWYFKTWKVYINAQSVFIETTQNSKIPTIPFKREDNYCFLHLSHIFMAIEAISLF